MIAEDLRLLSYKDLEELGYGSRPTIWRKVRAGKFPPPIDTNGGKRWPFTVIQRHVDNKMKEVGQ